MQAGHTVHVAEMIYARGIIEQAGAVAADLSTINQDWQIDWID
jgi:hypothetical protein